MPILPTVQRDSINVSGGSVNITPEQAQSAGGTFGQIGDIANVVTKEAKNYFIEEKVKFDRVRLIEAQNVMEGHKTRLTIDENEGFKNKLGEQAFLFQDEEGRDLVTSYSDRYKQAAQDTITQLKLTPDQQNYFNQMIQEDEQNWSRNLREHQVTQGFKYKESVLTNTVEIAQRKAMGSYQDIEALEDNLTTINASITEMGKQFGWSHAEVTNKIAETYGAVHEANMKQILDGGDFELGEAYLENYSAQMPELNRHAFASSINQLKEEYSTQQAINMLNMGVQEGSNPAYGTADPSMLDFISVTEDDESTVQLTPEEKAAGLKAHKISAKSARNINYKDPRLDALTEKYGRELGMDWAKPIVTALRVVGEKSNGDQKSPKGARGVMQFMPIAIEDVRRATGKKIDPHNAEESIWAAYKYVDLISGYVGSRDPALIASWYNGGGQFINQIKKGGVNSISDDENRNYVKRINGFLGGTGYSEHINRPMIGDAVPAALLAGKSPQAQAKIIAAHKNLIREQEQRKKQESENLYEAAIDAVDNGRITSIQDLDINSRRTLTASQQKSIEDAIKANRLGEYDDTNYLDYLTNPTVIKTMSNGEFKSFLMTAVPPDKRASIAKDYALLTGRTVADARAIDKQSNQGTGNKPPKDSIVSPENITKVLTRNAGAIGFVTGKTGTSKKAGQNQKGSAFWVATINDITDRVRESERRSGRNFTSAQIDSVVNAYLEKSLKVNNGTATGQVYDPKSFKRKDVPGYINDYVLRNTSYDDIEKVPDSVFMKYYFRWYRGKR